jgi:ArsR family transcriptional regulator
VETVTEQLEREVELLHTHVCGGLGNPNRILILYLLADHPRNVTELTDALSITQPTVSSHLKILRDCGLVLTKREGSAVYYSLVDPRIIEALNILRAILADLLTQQANLFSR